MHQHRFDLWTRIVLVILAALLALPLAPTAAPAAAKKRSRTVTRTFANIAGIELPIDFSSPVSASLYPSTISVSGLKKGKIRDVNLRLNDFSHNLPRDAEVLLVGPTGQSAIVMAYVGGVDDVANVTLRLDDEAEEPLPSTSLHSGAFRPTNAKSSTIGFNPPAPSMTANTSLAVFDGSNPDGTWRLFVQDDYALTDPGAFAGGWELEIEAKVKAKKKKQ